MIGSIIGDVVGSTYEFNNTKDYNFDLFPAGSSYTDDTVLSLAVASWLMKEGRVDFRNNSNRGLVKKFLEFGNKYPNPVGGYGSGFSTWLFNPKFLYSYDKGGDMESGYRRPYNSCGNGAAMRVSPIGWFYQGEGYSVTMSRKLSTIAAKACADVTHNHPEGEKGAIVVSTLIALAIHGYTKEQLKEEAESHGYDLSKSWEELHKTYKWDSSCQGTVPPAIICFLESNNFEDAIRKAVSIGGDSDTLACITGGIAEAYYKEIPMFMMQKALSTLTPHLRGVLHRFLNKVNYNVKFI